MALDKKVTQERERLIDYLRDHPIAFVTRSILEPGYPTRLALRFPQGSEERNKLLPTAVKMDLAKVVAYTGIFTSAYLFYSAIN